MSARFEYRLDLNEFKPVSNQIQDLALILRQPAPPDSQALAELMLDSYRGTVDYDGETLADAQQEVDSYFEGASGEPLLDHSRLCFSGGRLQSACLASYWGQEPAPLIAYVMTATEAKNQGLASRLLTEVLTNLQNRGYTQARAFITSGNIASEKIFLRLGFFKASGTG
jgi:RimJ/RimL family protein N-acetyltransferase